MNKFLFYNYLPVLADHIIDAHYSQRIVHHNYPEFNVKNIKYGDFIFVKTDFLNLFFKKYYQLINNKFYIITGVSDYSINDDYIKFLDEDKIIRWIGTNISFEHEKVFKIPIGFEENELSGGDQVLLEQLYKNKVSYENKKNKLLLTQMGNTHKSRKNLQDIFKNKNYCEILTKRIEFKDFMNKINENKFVLSPRGNGIDTHRFWEILLMGSVPVVETSELDDLYNIFPCIIVNNFNDISEDLLESYTYDYEKAKNIEKYLLIENFKKLIYNFKNN
jgi:hypothetical protein